MSKRLVYICSKYSGNREENKREAEAICRVVMNHYPDVIPIAPHVYFPQFLDDSDPTERSLGMEAGLALLDMCDEIWVYDLKNPSEGMKAEIDYALMNGIKIRDGFDHNNGAMQPEEDQGAAILTFSSRTIKFDEGTVSVKLARESVFEMAKTLKRKRGHDMVFEMRPSE